MSSSFCAGVLSCAEEARGAGTLSNSLKLLIPQQYNNFGGAAIAKKALQLSSTVTHWQLALTHSAEHLRKPTQ